MKNNLKRIFIILLPIFMFMLSIDNVQARLLDINEVSNEFNNSPTLALLKYFAADEYDITSSVDTASQKFDVYNKGEKVLSFDYTSEYLEYSNRDAVVTREVAEEDGITFSAFAGLCEAIFKLSGHANKTISSDLDANDFISDEAFNTYGLKAETDHYNFEDPDVEGDFIRYIKLSLDTDKIDALVDRYGTNSTQDNDNSLVPTVTAENITGTTVTIIPRVETDDEEIWYCYVYRSTLENDGYEKISDSLVNCSDGSGIIDDNLVSGTTYYYKASLQNSNKLSNAITVTIQTAGTTNNGVDNPKTGASISTISMLVIIFAGLFGIIYTYKKSAIKQI